MSTLPQLPNYSVQPVQVPDQLAQYGRLLQLKQMQQQQQEFPLRMQALQQQTQLGAGQVQQQQIQLKDQQAMTAAMQSWDGKDVNALVPLVIKNGASAGAVMGLKKNILDQQTQIATAAKDNGQAAEANVQATMKKNDLITGALSPLVDPKQVPDAQLPQTLQSTVQGLVQQNLLDPAHAQKAEQLVQSGDPNAIRQGIDQFRKTLMAQSQIMDNGLKTAQTQSAQTTTAKNQAESQYYQQNGGAPGVPLGTQAANIYAIPEGQRTPAQKLFLQGFEKYNNVTKIQPAAARVQMYMQMPQAVVDPNDPSREIYATKQQALGMEAPASGAAAGARKVLTSAIGGKLGDTINAYNTASAHLDMLSQAADALNNGNIQALNRVGNEFNKQTGNPAPTNFQAVKDAVAGEVSKTFKGGQATDAEIKQAEDAISSAGSPAQLKGVINTYKGLMASKRSAIQQQVEQGTQGKVNFGGESSPTAATAPTGTSVGTKKQFPNGKTGVWDGHGWVAQ